MTYIDVRAPEGHLWHGRLIHVCGAARHTILTQNGTFTWCAINRRWAWVCDGSITLVWPEPSSAEHGALMAQFEETAPPLRAAEGAGT